MINRLYHPESASAVTGIAWPPLPDRPAQSMLAMQYQLDKSQWWQPQWLLAQQLQQLSHVLHHATQNVPFYTKRWRERGVNLASPLTLERFRQLPILRREEIQTATTALHAVQYPKQHGHALQFHTSGSTGKPLMALGTELTQFLWNAITLREHMWHKRDFRGKLAVIRTTVEDSTTPWWGSATHGVFQTGPCVMLNIRHDLETQLAWLSKENPDYLLSHPSNLAGLAQLSIAKGIQLPQLKQIRSFGECVTAEIRSLCQRAWGVQISDVYSSEELGYITLQCPEHEHHHVQSESVLMEVLDDNGQPCHPGEVGRVVISSLHNFAMPLIRYEIQDYAEVGEPCACGRGLPVIKRIMGRQRNLITLPDGSRHWPSFPAETWSHIGTIRQIQLVQKSTRLIVARLVSDQALNEDQASQLAKALQQYLGYPFTIQIERVGAIERNANYKYEDFVSELT